MKSKIFKGAFVLIIAGIIGKVLGAFYRIPLSNILGAEGIGLYQMIFPLFSLALIVSSSGVNATLSHLIAKARAEKTGNIKNIFLKGLIFSLSLSLVFSLFFYIFAEKIAVLQGNILASSGYKIMIIALIFSSLLAPFRGYFQGYENMIPTAISQSLEQIFKVTLGIWFSYIFVGKGVEIGVVGAFLGISLAEIIAFLYLLIKFIIFKKTQFENKQKIAFIGMNFRFTASFLIIPLILAFDSFVVINLLNINFTEHFSTVMYGLQSGLVNSLINFPIIISVSISLALLPSLTFLISDKHLKEARNKLVEIFKMLWIIILPCIIFFIIFSPLIMKVLYRNVDNSFLEIASILLKISAPQILFISVLQISIAVFQSLGKEKTPIYILLICAIIKIILTVLLVKNPNIHIYGVALANFVFYALASIISLIKIKKMLKFSLDFKTFIITTSFFIVLSISFYLINVFIQDIWAKLSLIVFSGLVCYLLPLALFKVLDISKFYKENLKRDKRKDIIKK